MAVTQYQQFLADKAQTPNDPEECCLSMGGVVDFVRDTCILGNNEIDLSDSCEHAQDVAENAPDANTQQSGGGLGAWLSTNLETIFTIGSTILGGGPQQTSLGPQTNLDTDTNTDDEDNKKTLIAVAVAILVVVVAILLIRKSRK